MTKGVMILLLMLVVVLLALNLLQADTARWLVETNQKVLNANAVLIAELGVERATRTMQDAKITYKLQHDGSLVVIVNDLHEHVIEQPCRWRF